MNRFLEDVMAQPDSIRKALSFYKEQDYAREMKKLGGFDKVVFAGMGSSHHCNYGAAIHLAEHGVYAAVKVGGPALAVRQERDGRPLPPRPRLHNPEKAVR